MADVKHDTPLDIESSQISIDSCVESDYSVEVKPDVDSRLLQETLSVPGAKSDVIDIAGGVKENTAAKRIQYKTRAQTRSNLEKRRRKQNVGI